MNRFSTLQLANIGAFIVTLVINFFSQSASAFGLELFPNTVAELGESRAIFFLPAGYVFAIWGIIYLGMAAFIVYQGRPSQRENPLIARVGWWFVLSCVGNSVWLILFLNNQVVASTAAILLLFVSLLAIYLRVGIGRTAVNSTVRWSVHIPFSIYLGWVSVATVANIAAALYVSGSVTSFAGITADVWAVILMLIATGLALAMLFTRNDIAYALVIVWAVLGIYVRPFDTAVFEALAALNAGIVNAAAIILPVLILGAIGAFIALSQRRRSQAA